MIVMCLRERERERERVSEPFDRIQSLVEGVEGAGDAEELLFLIDGFLVGAEHDLEESGEGELDGSFFVGPVGRTLEETE